MDRKQFSKKDIILPNVELVCNSTLDKVNEVSREIEAINNTLTCYRSEMIEQRKDIFYHMNNLEKMSQNLFSKVNMSLGNEKDLNYKRYRHWDNVTRRMKRKQNIFNAVELILILCLFILVLFKI